MRDALTGMVIGSRIAWVLGLLALLLAMLGAIGVFASMVEERRREIGGPPQNVHDPDLCRSRCRLQRDPPCLKHQTSWANDNLARACPG